MLTVRNINNLTEHIFEAETVWLCPQDPLKENSSREVVAHCDDSIIHIDSGTVYVMNRFGATVARYQFEVPSVNK